VCLAGIQDQQPYPEDLLPHGEAVLPSGGEGRPYHCHTVYEGNIHGMGGGQYLRVGSVGLGLSLSLGVCFVSAL